MEPNNQRNYQPVYRRNNRELWLAFFAILFITVTYMVMLILLDGIPKASDFYGHALGVLGFILMLMTETLYTLRKRSRSARWGRMAEWLNFHIFTGIIGPYMVLLHSSWKFNGLAGLAMLLTIVIVASGFIGRYIYTAVPRTVDGVEIEVSMLEQQAAAIQSELQNWMRTRPEVAQALGYRLSAEPVLAGNTAALVFERAYVDWRQRWHWWTVKRHARPELRTQLDQLERLARRQDTLRRQVASLAMARRMLAVWHAVHIPIGMALFTAAFIHMIAAIYYATLLR